MKKNTDLGWMSPEKAAKWSTIVQTLIDVQNGKKPSNMMVVIAGGGDS